MKAKPPWTARYNVRVMYALEWQHIWARYDRAWALSDATLGVRPLQCLALIGPSGGGKSSLLLVAEGALRAAHGSVWLDGRPVGRRASRILGATDRLSPGLTVERQMQSRLYRCGARGRDLDRRLRTALHAWDLEAWRTTRIRALPASTLQRARLAVPWACPGGAWLLDDPSRGLEPEWRAAWPALARAWREREGGVVVVALSDPDEGATADHVAIVHQGRVVAHGPPERLCRVSCAEEIVVRTLDDRAAAAALSSGLRLEAERRSDGLVLRVRHADSALPGVINTLGRALETVWIRRPTLQDAVAHHIAIPPPRDLPTQPPRR